MRIPFTGRFDHHLREVAHGALVAFATKGFAAALTFAFNVIVARLLGPSGAGVFFLALTLSMIASVLGRVGLDNAILRFIAGGAALEDWAEVKGIYEQGMWIAFGASCVATIVTYASAPVLAVSLFSKAELTGPLRIMALAVPPITFLFLHSEALKGLKRIFHSQLVHGVALPAAALLFIALHGRHIGVTGVARSYVAAACVAAFLGFALWKAATPHLASVKAKSTTIQLFASSLPLFWVASMDLVMAWTGIVLLGVWGTTTDVGIFTVATRTALVTSLVLISVNSIAAPKFAELYRKEDWVALTRTARDSTKFMALLASPALAIFLILPGLVMYLFGAEFRAGGDVLRILALGQFVNVATGSVGYLLMMSGHERLVRNNIALAAGLNLVLNCALIPPLGRVGAAVATAIGTATLNLGAAYWVWNRLNIVTIPVIPQPGRRVHVGDGSNPKS